MHLNEHDQRTIDELMDRIRAKGREPLAFFCGPAPKPEDHVCDNKGPVVDVKSGFGAIHSATCSVCGREAFDSWSMWDV